MAVLPTVKVALDDDYMIINESDFDPDIHSLFEPQTGSEVDRESRQKELQAMNWQKLKAIAEGFEPPIEKHEDGWDETIPAILDREFSEQV